MDKSNTFPSLCICISMMPQSISPATLFAFLEVASVPVLQHKVIIYLNTAYWHTYPVFQQSEACGAFVGLKTSTMEASADKKARKSTSESEVEGGILGDFMGFKMNCESVFLFSFHPSLTSSPSSPGFYYCLSTSSAPPLHLSPLLLSPQTPTVFCSLSFTSTHPMPGSVA